jgi:hypothetical protein
MDYPITYLPLAYGFLPIAISVVALLVAWPQIDQRLLFFLMAMLAAFGVKQVVIDYVGGVVDLALWYSLAPFSVGVSMLTIKIIAFVIAEVVLVPVLLWRLFLVVRKTPSDPRPN